VLYCFGNIQVFGRIVDVGATHVIAEAAAWDMERNTRRGQRVSRRITSREGKRFSEDMIGVTSNAAISIAIRNAILTTVPRPLWEEAYEASLGAALGEQKTFTHHRKEWIKWWKDEGGSEDQLWLYLDIKGPDDMGGFEIRRMFGLRNAIEEGHTTFQRELDLLRGEIPEDEAADLDATIMNVE
jgi:hypothetical protein